ncbi:alpha/beta hydrolase [Microbacterium fluvii]|uniref:Alpha/beta hydrolase n=1 Tax=Microbacterium fluvii TaxID=415215 RepID=A0ABW2HEN6_9MICO|nr:alpha/beta hydrolase [Microbacterium fluvii]MCU4671852.1 alpha/beta hydrolase [Microbacterium fluvii]
MHLTSHSRVGDLVERSFTLDGVPGILWTPAGADRPSPLILMGHPGGIERMHPRLVARAARAAADGFATATIELPGSGVRPPLPGVDAARADLRRALQVGESVSADVIDRLILPLVDQAVPEWQQAIDALLERDEITGPVGFSGGVISIAVRLAAVDPRIRCAGLFAGSYVPAATMADAARLTIPLHVLLQWDDAGNDRQQALDLFDAFASTEKTLEANMGGHTGVPLHAGESAAAFFARHLRA